MEPSISTRWCVITGPPSSGKTTLIEALAARGWRVVHDVSRQIIEDRLASGAQHPSTREEHAALQQLIHEAMLREIKTVPPEVVSFHDYALPDNVAFAEELLGYIPPNVLTAAQIYRYAVVFICDPLPFVKDRIRAENAAFQRRLWHRLQNVYNRLGYVPRVLPPISVAARLDIVVRTVSVAPDA